MNAGYKSFPTTLESFAHALSDVDFSHAWTLGGTGAKTSPQPAAHQQTVKETVIASRAVGLLSLPLFLNILLHQHNS